MKNKIVAIGVLSLMVAAPVFAAVLGGPSGIREEIQAPAVTQAQAIDSELAYDKWVAEHPGFLGEPMRYVSARQEQAKTDLALYDAASSSFRTAGPTGPSEKELRTQYLKMVVDRPGFLGEPLRYIQARKADAEKELGQ